MEISVFFMIRDNFFAHGNKNLTIRCYNKFVSGFSLAA